MEDKNYYVNEHAVVDENVELGEGTKVWHNAQIRPGAVIGKNCNIGKGVYIDSNVEIGNNCKIQNYVSIYDKAIIEDDVFVGPAVTFTNDRVPRAFNWSDDISTTIGAFMEVAEGNMFTTSGGNRYSFIYLIRFICNS